MNDPVYVYPRSSGGTRRHIRAGRSWGSEVSLCNIVCDRDEQMVQKLTWRFDSELANRKIVRRRNMPVCATCIKSWQSAHAH